MSSMEAVTVGEETERAVLAATMFGADGEVRRAYEIGQPDPRVFNAGFHVGSVMMGAETGAKDTIYPGVSEGFERACARIEQCSGLEFQIARAKGRRAASALIGLVNTGNAVAGAILAHHGYRLWPVLVGLGSLGACYGINSFRHESAKIRASISDRKALIDEAREITGINEPVSSQAVTDHNLPAHTAESSL